MARAIGIGFGTTNCCVAAQGERGVVTVPNSEGSRTTPALVGFVDSGPPLIGELAKRQAIINAGSTIYGLPRLLGRKYHDPETRRFAQTCPYRVVEGRDGDAWVAVRGQTRTPEQVAALLFDKLRQTATAHLGQPVDSAVIGVPLSFGPAQRQALAEAARRAGLEVVRLVEEPLAAALGIDAARPFREAHAGRARRVAVYDLGGSSFCISILERRGNQFTVLSSGTNGYLGGREFDRCVVDFLAGRFLAEAGIDLRADRMALQRLQEAAETAKQELSSGRSASFNLPYIAADQSGPRHLTGQLSRGMLETLVDDLIEKTLATCQAALDEAGLLVDQIDDVILAGGQTRMPRVRELVGSFFGRTLEPHASPDEVVALGLAVVGAALQGDLPAETPGPPPVDEPDHAGAPVLAPPAAALAVADDELPDVSGPPGIAAFAPPESVPAALEAFRIRNAGPSVSPALELAPEDAALEVAGPPPPAPDPLGRSGSAPARPSLPPPGAATGVWVRPPPPPLPPPPRRGVWFLTAGAATILLLVPLWTHLQRPPRASAAEVAAPAANDSGTIPIVLDVRPPTASVELDGVPVAMPLRALPRDGRAHTLRFTATGYEPAEVPLEPDVLQVVRVELRQAPEPVAAASAAGRP